MLRKGDPHSSLSSTSPSQKRPHSPLSSPSSCHDGSRKVITPTKQDRKRAPRASRTSLLRNSSRLFAQINLLQQQTASTEAQQSDKIQPVPSINAHLTPYEYTRRSSPPCARRPKKRQRPATRTIIAVSSSPQKAQAGSIIYPVFSAAGDLVEVASKAPEKHPLQRVSAASVCKKFNPGSFRTPTATSINTLIRYNFWIICPSLCFNTYFSLTLLLFAR